MNPLTIAIIAFFALAVIVAIAFSVWMYTSNKRTKRLRSEFGPEYRRVARAEGDASAAEKVLQERQAREKKLEIKPLSEQQRNEFADDWETAQAEFVDDPTAAVAHADALVQEVMNVRGYPVAYFDQRVADLAEGLAFFLLDPSRLTAARAAAIASAGDYSEERFASAWMTMFGCAIEESICA